MRMALLAASAILVAHPGTAALASLGGPVSTIEKDRHALRGEIVTRVQAHDQAGGQAGGHEGYSVHEIQADGTVVREYALPDGTVFAVAWRGPSEPDLSVLLGKYYRDYAGSEAFSAPHRGRRRQRIEARGAVVERSGHMRDVRGKAYVRALMPEGLRAEDIG